MKHQQNKENRPKTMQGTSGSAEFGAGVSNNFDILGGKVDTSPQSILKPETDSSKTTRVTNRVLDVMPQIAAPMRRSNLHLEDAEVERLAIRAMDATSAMDTTTDAATPFARLFALADAYIDVEDTGRHEILESLLDRGIAPETIADDMVPAVAQYMGRLWEFDRISFAEVSIAAARLQETVRSLANDRKPEDGDADARILLVAPAIETHTLGIFVLSEQFRRLGCTVHVCVGNSPREIVSLVRRTPFDMIGITAGSRRSLTSVREIVKDLRGGVPRNNKIVLGGAVTQLELDLKLATGVDYVCDSVDQALAKCGIEMQKSKAKLV